MDSITVSSYRCFGGEQTARLAPITLLVGENSTGKSSLMAMIRALWDQVRKHDKRRKGPLHNLADMGYGVSQVLPLATELLRGDSPRVILVQQPEVHLHPSAEAALGTLLCEVAVDGRRDRRLIVETHSDFIIDRVRMSVRDGVGGLKPKDVSILYFERGGLDVTIHNLRVDERGNLLDVPPGYRQFFLKELQRSIDL